MIQANLQAVVATLDQGIQYTHTQITVSNTQTTTIQLLMDSFLHENNLAKDTIIGMSYNGKPLYKTQTLQFYGLTMDQSTVQATVYTSDLLSLMGHTPVYTDIGKKIRFLLQTKEETPVLTMGNKQNLNTLVDKYRTKK
jgi:hypothetical protein